MPETREDIAKRRAARRRKIRKRRLKIAFIFFLVTALAVGAVLSLTVLFPIKHVKVSGSSIYSAEEIISSSKINSKNNFFTISKEQVEKTVRMALPFVDTITLERDFPDTVILKVKDAKPTVNYVIDGKYYVVSDRGYVLGIYDTPPENTFSVLCEGVSGAPGEQIKFEDEVLHFLNRRIVQELNKKGIHINGIDITDSYNIKLKVEGRFDVIIGASSDLENKIAHLSGMIDAIEPQKQGEINLSMWTSSKSEGTFTEKMTDTTAK